MSATTSTCSRTASAVGWAKMVRIVAATISAWPLVTLVEHVAHEVDPAALPGRALQDRADGVDQAAVGVGDDQLDAVQAAVAQVAQELGPELLGLAVADLRSRALHGGRRR